MPRRRKSQARDLPDPKFITSTRQFVNVLMTRQESLQRDHLRALDSIKSKSGKDRSRCSAAVQNVKPWSR